MDDIFSYKQYVQCTHHSYCFMIFFFNSFFFSYLFISFCSPHSFLLFLRKICKYLLIFSPFVFDVFSCYYFIFFSFSFSFHFFSFNMSSFIFAMNGEKITLNSSHNSHSRCIKVKNMSSNVMKKKSLRRRRKSD